MTQKLTIRKGGASGATIQDFSAMIRLFDATGDRAIFGGMKFNNGDSASSQAILLDEDSVVPNGDANNLTIYGFNEVVWSDDSPGYEAWLSVGRVSNKDWARPAPRTAGVTRQGTVQWIDMNADLKGIVLLTSVDRPEETAGDRMQWVIETFYQGDPRDSTDIQYGHLIGSGTGFDNVMDATTYKANTEAISIIEECNNRAGKIFGVVAHEDSGADHKCFLWIGETNHTTYASDLSISDVWAEVDQETVFYAVWRNGTAATEDPTQVISGVGLTYGPDADETVFVTDSDLSDQFDYYVGAFTFDRARTPVWATARAENILTGFGKEYITLQPSILIPASLHNKVRAGMSISVRSDAAFGGEDQGIAQMKRISSVEFEPAGWKGEVLYLWANLQLDQPLRILTLPDPNHDMGPQPPSGSCTDLTGGTEIDTFAEHNTTGHWCSNSNFIDYSDGGARVGTWHVGYANVLTAANNFMVYTFTGTFTAGHRYVFGFWVKTDKTEDMTAYFGESDTACIAGVSVFTGDVVSQTISDADGTWKHYEMEWTPATTIVSDGSNGTASAVRWALDSTGSAGGNVLADGGTLQDCSDATIPPASDDDTGSSGDDCTEYACADHKHPWQTAAHTPITDSGGYYTSDDVEGALQEIGAAGGTPYTDEDAQDAVGTILTDSSTVDFTYTDATPAITAAVIPSGIKLDDFGAPDDNTDLNASTSAHGLLPKLGGGTTNFLRADGTWNAPAGGGGSLTVEEVDGSPTDSAVTKLIFPNGTLSITSHEATYTPAGGGGGGASSPYYLDTPTLDATYGDEFDGTSLNARWTRLNISANTEEFTAGSWMRLMRNVTVPSGGEGYYQTPASMQTYMELIWSGSFMSDISTGGSPQAGPFLVTSAGAGLGAAINPQGNYFRLATLSSGAPSGGNTLTHSSLSGVIGAGMKHWVRLIRMVADGLTLYFAQYSTDGNTWSAQISTTDSTAVTRIGFGRFVGITTAGDTLSTDRFNTVPLTLGNNLCRTPSSGTATYTASSSFSGFSASSAFDGNDATDWASNGYSAGQYIQCAWSVAQSVNTIILRGRTSDQWGHGHIEFSDGSTVPLGWMGTLIQNTMVVRLPSTKSTTLLKVISDSDGGTNPGFREIQAFNAT